jgi:nicotinamidase/pyrazinamidase
MRDIAFLDTDTQFDFMLPSGALYVPGAEKLIPNLKRLTSVAALRGVPVIASVDAHFENDPEFGQWPPHCVLGTPGQEKIPETRWDDAVVVPNHPQRVELRPGAQIVLEKRIYSVFDNVNADVILEKLSAREFVAYGVATDYCVKAAVLGLLERGYAVRVVTDAVKGITPEAERQALDEMCAAGAKLTTTDEVVASLGGDR